MAARDALSRKRQRRVADELRKRASRACDRCKARKGKCVETPTGDCERCLRLSLPCHFEKTSPESSKDLSPNIAREDHATSLLDETANAGFSVDESLDRGTLWLGFFTRLRENFLLEPDMTSAEHNLITQAKSSPLLPQSPELSRIREAISAFPPRHVTDFLISVLITYATDLFFYYDQAALLAEIDQFYNDPNSPLRVDANFVCFGLAVLALGSHWTVMERPTETTDRTNRNIVHGDPGRVFYDHAKILLPDIIDRPGLRGIQAVFVLGVYLLPTNALGPAYIYMGLALRTSLTFNLHLDNGNDSSISTREKEVRRRLWWTIFSLERCITVKLHRSRSIDPSIITAPLPTHLPELDDVQTNDNHLHQIAYAKLVLSSEGVSDLSDNGNGAGGTSELRESSEDPLKLWKRSLPPALKLDGVDMQKPGYRAVFHLHLQYYYTLVERGKTFVISLVREYVHFHLRKIDKPPQSGTKLASQAERSIEAAGKMIQLFEKLKTAGWLSRFSFTDFQGCSMATIVVLIASVKRQTQTYLGRVDFGMECLRSMAQGNESAKIGVRFVEALQAVMKEVTEKMDALKATTHDSERPQDTSQSLGYEGWAEWMANSQQKRHDSLAVTSPQSTSPPIVLGELRQPLPTYPADHLTWPENSMSHLTVPDYEHADLMDSRLFGHQVQRTPSVMAVENAFQTYTDNDDQSMLTGLTGFNLMDFTGFA